MTEIQANQDAKKLLSSEQIKQKALDSFASTINLLGEFVTPETSEKWKEVVKELLSTVIDRSYEYGYEAGKSSVHSVQRGEE